MTLLELLKRTKIDLSIGLISPDTGGTLSYDFEITPKEFLSYSKQDFKQKEQRGAINALTNAKRAIDCQTDKIFYSIGLDTNKLPIAIEKLILSSKNGPIKKDLPIKFRFLQSIGFAPAEIITNARKLRHKLEHYYKRPSNEEVSKAIELAELFILATESKLKSMWDFSITDAEKAEHNDDHLRNCIYVQYNYKKNNFIVEGFNNTGLFETIQIKNTEIEFFHLLKVATSLDDKVDAQDALIDLMEAIGHPIPSKNISIHFY